MQDSEDSQSPPGGNGGDGQGDAAATIARLADQIRVLAESSKGAIEADVGIVIELAIKAKTLFGERELLRIPEHRDRRFRDS